MIIRSQNKKSIVNLDNTFEISAHDKKVVVSGLYSAVGLLGIYSTEEKAIKVLDMIQKFYEMHDYAKFMGKENAIYGSCIFEMPQDSEV